MYAYSSIVPKELVFSVASLLVSFSILDAKMSMGKNICQMKRFMGTSSVSARSSVFSIYQTKLISDYITER